MTYSCSPEQPRLTGRENMATERTLSTFSALGAVNSPTCITLENNGKIRPQPDRENRFAKASGGGTKTGVEPSLRCAWPLAPSIAFRYTRPAPSLGLFRPHACPAGHWRSAVSATQEYDVAGAHYRQVDDFQRYLAIPDRPRFDHLGRPGRRYCALKPVRPGTAGQAALLGT